MDALTDCVEFLVNKLANIFLSKLFLLKLSFENSASRRCTLLIVNNQHSRLHARLQIPQLELHRSVLLWGTGREEDGEGGVGGCRRSRGGGGGDKGQKGGPSSPEEREAVKRGKRSDSLARGTPLDMTQLPPE